MPGKDDNGAPATLLVPRADERVEQGFRLLVISDGECSSHALPERGRLTVGRSTAADVRIDRPWISRQHALVHLGTPIKIEDLGSSNGTSLRGERLSPGRPVPVNVGDVIEIGRSLLVIRRSSPAPEVAHHDEAANVAGGAVIADAAMVEVYRLVDLAAAGTINVLLLGETGVGKEVIAEQLHRRSPRAAKPFLRLHCAALPEMLLESELFGHERGAFTGAAVAKPGLLETADGGTVFLDEIGELPPSMQVKLLRVVEEQQVQRLGSVKPRPMDVRFVSATNQDLETASAGFRRDLFFRLNGILIRVPPLRERIVEVAPLARSFIQRVCEKLGRQQPSLSSEAQAQLESYPWPGNIRELRNVIERAVLLCADDCIEPKHLSVRPVEADPQITIATDAEDDEQRRILEALGDNKRRRILQALDQAAGNQTRAAKLLGVSRGTLMVWLDKYSIPRPRKPI